MLIFKDDNYYTNVSISTWEWNCLLQCWPDVKVRMQKWGGQPPTWKKWGPGSPYAPASDATAPISLSSDPTRKLPGERDNARNMPGARRRGSHARLGWTTSRLGQDSPWKSQSEWQRTEINGENTFMAWPTLGSRTTKEQNRTVILRLAFQPWRLAPP